MLFLIKIIIFGVEIIIGDIVNIMKDLVKEIKTDSINVKLLDGAEIELYEVYRLYGI